MLALALVACGDADPGADPDPDATDAADATVATEVIVPPDATERDGHAPPAELRAALGVPPEATRVLVFGQGARVAADPQASPAPDAWSFVDDIFSRALDALAADPDYRYAISEVAWLRRYWESHPERRDAIRAFNAQRRLAVVGGAVSSPDVLLPLGESLLRDYRAGARWLHSVGLERTASAWLPDAAGLGVATPDLLAAAGFDAVAFWHADGTAGPPPPPTTVADYAALPHAPGSGASELTAAGALDFIWYGAGGAKVFAHWMAHGHLGDHLDFTRIDRREPGQPAGVHADEAGVLDNLQAMADLVLAMSPTDYGFIPVGGDLQYPKADLTRWMRAWNEQRYPSTGIWVVAATFDDFARLAMSQSDRLYVRAADFTPYQMGAYATHERLKADARLASAALTQAEAVAAVAGLDIDPAELDRLTWRASQTDHHDWIAGTSARSVFAAAPLETTRVLRADAEALRDGLMSQLAERVATDALVLVNTDQERPFARFAVRWSGPDGKVSVREERTDSVWPGYVEGGVLRGTAWLLPLSAGVFRVAPWSGAEDPMAVRCMTGEATVSCDVADRVEVDQGPFSTLTFDRRSGGTWLTLDGTPDGSNLLTAPALRFFDYLDAGGPATFAHELAEPSCAFASLGEVVPQGPVAVAVAARPDATVVAFSWEQGGVTWKRQYRIGARQLDPVDVELTVGVAPGHTLVARIDTRVDGDLWTAAPGGVVKRPAGGRLTPTFWPFERWVAKVERDVAAFGIIAPSSPAVAFDAAGGIELVLAREAGDACGDPEGGAPRAVTVSLRVVSTYANGANGGVAATMDEHARDLYTPVLGARGTGQVTDVDPTWLPSITTRTSDAVFFDLRVRVVRFAKTPEGYELTLEKRMLNENPLEVVLSTGFPAGTVIEQLDAADGLGQVLAGASPEHVVVPLYTSHVTLRFRPPEGTGRR